jgi:hypothetical protein
MLLDDSGMRPYLAAIGFQSWMNVSLAVPAGWAALYAAL